MGFKIIMFTLWKLGPNLLPGPDMKRRQKWTFCGLGPDPVGRVFEFASIWGCLGPSPTSADERQAPLRGGGKNPHETHGLISQRTKWDRREDTVSRVCYIPAIRYVIYRLHRL